MTFWSVTLTLDVPVPDEVGLHELVHALPAGGTAGRSPYGPQLRVGVTVHRGPGAQAEDVAGIARILVEQGLAVAGLLDVEDNHYEPPAVLGVLVLHEDEAERRDVERDPFADLIGADEAGKILGISPNAVRARAEALCGRQVAGTWLFLRPAIEASRRT